MPRRVNHLRAAAMASAAAWLAARDAWLYEEYPAEERAARRAAAEAAEQKLAIDAGWYLLGHDRCHTAMDAHRQRRIAAEVSAERASREVPDVAPQPPHDEPWECVINCTNPQHCEGCDQHEPTTRERLAHERGKPDGIGLDGAAYLWPRVRWCDQCAEIVNAGVHDTYDRVTGSGYLAAEARAQEVAHAQ